jgi:signal transduction histidine kinase
MSTPAPPRILIVDDNPDIHADFHKILAPPSTLQSELAAAAGALFNRAPAGDSKACFELDSANQGQEGLERVKSGLAEGRPYDAAFVDMRMPPGWDGLETIIRLWSAQPSLQCIICTAYSDYSWEEINHRLAQSDRFLILKKPFDNVEVRQLASALTSRARVERELAESNRRLMETSRHAGMAEVATSVLHNVGNVLNSVNVAATLIQDRLRRFRFSSFAKTVDLLAQHEPDLGTFLTTDPKGRQLPAFLKALSEHFHTEHTAVIEESVSLIQNVEHIKEIVAMQQNLAKLGGVVEPIPPVKLMEDALRIKAEALLRHRIEIVRDFADVPPVTVDRHKVLQILVNLLGNAKHAINHHAGPERRITVRIRTGSAGRICLEVQDTGEGIPAENLTRIFQYGFTTRKDGHGFGLHSGANAAREMGGSLTMHSAGRGQGATFTLELPMALPASAAHAA